MAIAFTGTKKSINARRRENKKHSDLLQKGSFRREVKIVFNTYYKEQAEALYRQICRAQ